MDLAEIGADDAARGCLYDGREFLLHRGLKGSAQIGDG
jgi:hypothetical protein